MTADCDSIVAQLAAVIEQRQQERPAASYTAQLLSAGHDAVAAKIVEEAYELVAAGAGDEDPMAARRDIAHEAADVIYHVLVYLTVHGATWGDVEMELQQRFGVSGLAEKAARRTSPESLR